MENKENNLQTKETIRKLQEVVKDCLSNKEIKNELFPDGEPDFEKFIMTMVSLDLDRYFLKCQKQKRAKRIMNAILFLILAVKGMILFYFSTWGKEHSSEFFKWLKYLWK